jgi:hypothetical protein
MFTAYIDDSGTAPDQKVSMATALVIPASRIIAFQSEWSTFLRKWGISDFHTSECAVANHKSQYAGWNQLKIQAIFARVRQIIKKYGARSYSLSVNKPDYEAIVPTENRAMFGKHHYTYAIHNLLSVLDAWACRTGVEHPLEYVFDWMAIGSPERREIEDSLARSEAALPGRFEAHYSFCRRKETPGLQCVDLIGWTCYRYALNTHGGPPLTELQAQSMQDFQRWKRGEWLTAVGQTRQQISRAVDSLRRYDGTNPLQVRTFINGDAPTN